MTEAAKPPQPTTSREPQEQSQPFQDQLDSQPPTGFVVPGKNAPHKPDILQQSGARSPYNIVTD